MFDRLFKWPHVLARHQAGPLLEERRRYLTHRAEQGMTHWTLRLTARYLLIIARFLRLADRPAEAISRAEVEQQALLWAAEPHPSKSIGSAHARELFRSNAFAWLRFLGRLEPVTMPPQPYAQEIAAFAEFLSSEKGLALITIDRYCFCLRDLLGRICPDHTSLQKVTIAQIDEALVGQTTDRKYSRATVQILSGALRSFFRYGESRGWCRAGLAVAIKGPRVYAQESIPFGPSWDEVQQLLKLTEGDRPDNIRDRALFLLLAVYGFRAGEVVRLRLDDFDWEQELITVASSKSGLPRTYPLASPVAAAVLRYLQEVRPRMPLREVFLSRQAPIRPLHPASLYVIVARRLRVLSPSLPRYGPHALRHACATHLLQQGLSLKEIGDHLGHRDPDTTRIYTKVDLASLRQVADIDLGGLV